ncbi:hypothetical protein LAZ67_6000140 [Cordylochernes scorpioides]|uniref:Transposase n=1 Tax=Cordylochernes scorpioides TaxID=51811 RepID=A0ABY6KIZ0_9ARAC|nr:hypothetical protein LAZ67_6000140 [Cordylochernes scorpioides]
MRQKSWGLLGQFPKRKPRPNRLGKKAMLCVWWDQTGVVYFKLLKPGETVNTSRYEQQMHSLREALNEKRPELREKHNKLILQHDNAPARNATVVKNTIKDLGWELLPHPPYSPDLAPSDYHLFTSLGHALKNQEFSNSDILRKWLVDWFDSKGIEIFRQGIRKLPERWSECIEVAASCKGSEEGSKDAGAQVCTKPASNQGGCGSNTCCTLKAEPTAEQLGLNSHLVEDERIFHMRALATALQTEIKTPTSCFDKLFEEKQKAKENEKNK